MSRINTNVQSLIAQRSLGSNASSLNTSLERLSTGVRINRGKDDPAGLIASENLRAEITSTNAAIKNSERSDQVLSIAEGGLQEISSLLNELQGLLTTTANSEGLSSSEKDANQQQVDSILQTVDRLARSTSFQGIKLLNGNLDYTVTSVDSGVTDFKINSAKFETDTLDVDIAVTQSAQRAGIFLDFGGSVVSVNTASGSTFSLEIVGSLGSRELSFSSSTTLTDVAAAINTYSSLTGVKATASASGISLKSSDYGSKEFVSVRQTGGALLAGNGIYVYEDDDENTTEASATAAWGSSGARNFIRDLGQDIGGAINGDLATGNGLTLSVNTDFLDVDFTYDATSAQTLSSPTRAVTITGGGANFALGGNVNIGTRVSLGLPDVAARNLGTSSLGFLDELGQGKTYDLTTADTAGLSKAQKIVTESIDQIATLRGRLGAFQKNTVGATIRSLSVAVENTAAANSIIRDTDFASETAALTRGQILQQSATTTLSLANSSPQSVLSLIG